MTEAQGSFTSKIIGFFSPRLGFDYEAVASKTRLLSADATVPSRGMGRLIILISLLPFYSDLFVIPGDFSPWNGYDFFNHPIAIAIRLCIALPGLWILLFYSQVTRCTFDLEQQRYQLNRKSYLSNTQHEGELSDITDIEVHSVEPDSQILFARKIFKRVKVNLNHRSGESFSFIFLEHQDRVDMSAQKIKDLFQKELLVDV